MGKNTSGAGGLRSETLGLTIIGASLVVIAVIVVLLFDYQRDTRTTRTRSHGVSLVRLLSEMPLDDLIPSSGRNDLLQALIYTGEQTDLVYASVIDSQGAPIADVSHSGVLPPAFVLPQESGMWAGEREVFLRNGQEPALEFYAPVFEGPQRAGFVRLGYRKPAFQLGFSQLPFIASVALPVFLLAPFFHYLLRREIRPIHKANAEIGSLLEEGSLQPVQLRASGELGEFMQRFNAFVDLARNRIDTLEFEHQSLLTSSRLTEYRRTRIERVLEALPETVLVMDETGKASYYSARLPALLGAENAQIRDQVPVLWCPLPDVAQYLADVATRARGGFAVEALEFVPPNAPERSCSVQAFPLFQPGADDEVLGALVVFRDITDECLARRSRGEFVAHIAHELKTPLSVLSMYAEALQGPDGEDPAFRIEATNVLTDEVERLSDLIRNLLNVTRIEMGSLSLRKQMVKPLDLLNDAFATVARAASDKELTFKSELPPDVSPIMADKELLRVAINNLLTNAIKYNRPGGKVILTADDGEDSLSIRVSDTGIGISPQDQQRVFDKFFRAENEETRARTGHGLGLALTRDIVQLHNGALSVESTPGEGSTFTLRLWKDASAVRRAI